MPAPTGGRASRYGAMPPRAGAGRHPRRRLVVWVALLVGMGSVAAAGAFLARIETDRGHTGSSARTAPGPGHPVARGVRASAAPRMALPAAEPPLGLIPLGEAIPHPEEVPTARPPDPVEPPDVSATSPPGGWPEPPR